MLHFHVKSELQKNSEISTLCFVLSYLKFSFSIDDSKWLEGQNDAAVSVQPAGQLYWIYGPALYEFLDLKLKKDKLEL